MKGEHWTVSEDSSDFLAWGKGCCWPLARGVHRLAPRKNIQSTKLVLRSRAQGSGREVTVHERPKDSSLLILVMTLDLQ